METTQERATTSLPWLVEGDEAAALARDPDGIGALLAVHGAVLLRGAGFGGIDGFDDAVRVIAGDPLRYSERSSPRHSIKGNVYTSTEYPADQEIFLHNENSYQATWPRLLFFYCDEPSQTLGATPLADIRRVHDRIEPTVREEFARRKWMSVRNFHSDFGVSWRHVFGTDDRADVEAHCRANGIEFTWFGDDSLRTHAVREPIRTHPATGEPVWFNHATFFHHSTLPPSVREGLLAFLDPDELPTNSYYGDGGEIPLAVTEHLRACYRAESTRFDWERDDLLVVDNMLAAHAREPFTGRRRIAVAMAQAYRPDPMPTSPATEENR